MAWSGGCLCGTLRYECAEDPLYIGHCHCRACRKHSGAAFLTFVMFRAGHVIWAAREPRVYESSPGVERGFCPVCGSTLTFARHGYDEISVLAGSLDDTDAISPSEHIFVEQQCAWLRLDDALPRHARFPPGREDREPRR